MVKNINKLVRDNIPNIIKANGQVPYYKKLSDEELQKQLKAKLVEEVNEYLESESIEELADIVEVINAILLNNNFTLDDLEKAREEKVKSNGAFLEKYYLEKIEDKK